MNRRTLYNILYVLILVIIAVVAVVSIMLVFNIDTALAEGTPPDFWLLDPYDGEYVPAGDITFMWGEHPDAEYYELKVREVVTGDVIAYINPISPLACETYVCTQTLTLALDPMTQYKWLVKAYWDDGASKEKSAVRYFWLWLWP